MQIRIYTNNAYDTIALVNDDNQVISTWRAEDRGGDQGTALEYALKADDLSEWDDQFHRIDIDEFEEGQTLFLTIENDGSWHTNDRDILRERFEFHFGENHPIVKALDI